jgi:hypothetical protein
MRSDQVLLPPFALPVMPFVHGQTGGLGGVLLRTCGACAWGYVGLAAARAGQGPVEVSPKVPYLRPEY